jgi:hypothetical protein
MNKINIPDYRIQIFGIIVSLLLIIIVARLIIRGRLREEYAIIWAGLTIILLVFSLWRKAIDYIGRFFGVYDPPNLLFIIAIMIILIYLLHLSIIVSQQKDKIKRLTQELGLLKNLIEKYDLK